MKKLIYLLALLLPLAGFTQNTRAFYGSSISRSYGVDTLAGFKAVNTNTLGYAGLVAISAADTSAFFTNGTGHASIYNSAGVLRQPQYVGVGGSPDVSGTAYLSLTGTTGGFLTARMTAAQKNAIGSPATGLLIYQTDGTAGFYYYNGSAWGAVGGGSSGITVGTTTITSGTDYRVLFQDATASDYVTQTANFTMGAVASGFLDVPAGYALAGHKLISEVNTSSIRFGNGAAPSMTGATNTVIGYANAAGLTSGVNNVYLGTGQAIDVNSATSGNGVVIGANAGIYTQGSGNVVLGSGAGSNIIANNTIIGYLAGGDVGTYKYYEKTVMLGGGAGSAMKASSVGTISIGYFSCYQAFDCNYGIFIGYGAGGFSAHNSASFGTYSGTTAANQLVFGGSYAGTSHYSDVYFGSGVNDAAAKSVVINATGGSGTNNAGASLTLASGKGTGTAAGGNNVEQTSVKLASGTTLQPLTDRHNIVGKYVDITAGSAQTFGNLALATSSTVSGGTVIYTIEANDATDYQSLSGVLKYDVVNKAGTLTVAFEDDQNSACACSAGTLTATVTATASGTNVLFQANAASSLTETTLRVSFQVLNNFGQAVITPN